MNPSTLCHRGVVTAALVLLPVCVPAQSEAPQSEAPQSEAQCTAHAIEALARIPAAFVPNAGQWDHGLFRARLGGIATIIERSGLLLGLTAVMDDSNTERAAIRLRFVGASDCEATGEQTLPGRMSYFLGSDAARWHSDLPRFGRVRWTSLWPGIEIACYERDGHLEYDVELEPGADLRAVEIMVEGAGGLAIAPDGALVIETPVGALRQTAPVSWVVENDGTKTPIEVAYELRGTDRFGLCAPEWTGDLALVVDPGLLWATYLGGSELDLLEAIHVDAAGLITAAGYTLSADFPTTPAVVTYSQTFQGGPGLNDGCIVRFDPSQQGSSQLVAATFVGSPDSDAFNGLHVDAAGQVTVTGQCNGPSFPLVNVYSGITRPFTGPAGTGDVVVCRLDNSLAQLRFSSYVGGTGVDSGLRVHSDLATSQITVMAQTDSTDFPTTANAPQPAAAGQEDVAVLQIDPLATSVAALVPYSTYLGGPGQDLPHGMHVAANGQITVCGRTHQGGFPTTPNAFSTTVGSGIDGFVTRIDPTQSSWVYSTRYGGNGYDDARTLSVDGGGIVTFAGETNSSNLPPPVGGSQIQYQPNHSGHCPGCVDTYLARLDPSRIPAQQLIYSTYFGGPGPQGSATAVWDLDVDSIGVITFAGMAYNTTLPTTPGAWARNNNGPGNHDVFVARLDPSLIPSSQLLYLTYFGGPGREEARDISVAGTVVTVAGRAWFSGGMPTTPNAYDPTWNGQHDTMLFQIDMQPIGPPVLTAISPASIPTWQPGQVSLTGQNLQNVQSITVGNQTVTSFPTPLPTQIDFTPPSALVIGSHQVTVTDDLARTSNALVLNVTPPGTPVLDVLPTWVGFLPLEYRIIADANDLSLLLLSFWPGTTPVPGIVALPGLGIGGGSTTHLVHAAVLVHDAQGRTQTSVAFSPLFQSMTPIDVHAQAIAVDPLTLTLPIPASNLSNAAMTTVY